MSRYIDADAYRKKWADIFDSAYGDSCCEMFKKSIDEQPTADVVEVKHGKWLDYEDVENSIYGHVTCLCSVCGHVSQYKENYCMHCGADMRGEDDERNI